MVTLYNNSPFTERVRLASERQVLAVEEGSKEYEFGLRFDPGAYTRSMGALGNSGEPAGPHLVVGHRLSGGWISPQK